jgi:hypothetical protein
MTLFDSTLPKWSSLNMNLSHKPDEEVRNALQEMHVNDFIERIPMLIYYGLIPLTTL